MTVKTTLPYPAQRAFQFIASWLAFQAREHDIPGFTVVIHDKDSRLFEGTYGYAHVARGELLTAKHALNIGSQSKLCTSVAILQLAQQRKLSLDDRLGAYLPWINKHSDKRFMGVTIRQLLMHRAGITRDGPNADYWQLLTPFPDNTELRRLVLDSPLVLDGYQKLKYSNISYALLGQVVSAASGLPYDEYVTKNICEPLGIQAFASRTSDIEPPIAAGYSRLMRQSRIALPAYVPTHALSPATGWYMTAAEMSTFMQALFFSNRLLTDKYRTLLFEQGTPHWTQQAARDSGYGLGVQTYKIVGRHLVGHSGGFIGHRSAAFVDLLGGIGVVVMANAKDAPVMQILGGVLSTLDYFNRYATAPPKPEVDLLNIRLMNLWSTLEIVATHTRIVAIQPEQWLPFEQTQELEYVGPTKLRIRKANNLMAEGEMAHLTYRSGAVARVNYAGATLVPEKAFSNWLANHMPVE